MFKRRVLATSIMAASTSSPLYADIEEVVVTATKQAASTQDIPVAVNALSEDTLEQLGIASFADYLVQLPGVTAGGGGPGQNTIYIRGVASTTPNLTVSGVAGLAPNVALYLDEQPLSQPGRNLDVYAADLARVEVLAGPQGTLFGTSSQAGTVRLITNKPQLAEFSSKVKFGTTVTKNGEPGNNVEGVINIPLGDSVALRAVTYVDNQGGYINNVAGTRSAAASARFRSAATVRANGVPVGTSSRGFQSTANLSGVNFMQANNANRTEDNFNEATYAGTRASALWAINDNWELLLGAAQQTLDSEGVFYVDPTLDDLEIQRFERDSMEDQFTNANWTLTGRMAALEMVYTGAFTKRETNQFVDYTDYLFVGQYLPYYICDNSVVYPGENVAPSGNCQAPNLFVKGYIEAEFQNHELRFVTSQQARLRATFGAYYSDSEIREDAQFTYLGSELLGAESFGPNFSAQGASVRDPGLWAEGVIFRNDVLRTDEQIAAFGELTFDISNQFAATIGARWYDIEVDLKGSAAGSFSNKGASVDKNAGNNLDVRFSNATAGSTDVAATDGFIGKVTLSWTPDDNILIYATWSEGFRPGLLNRPGGNSNRDGSFTVPFAIDTDEVTNYEAGWKTDLLNGSLRFNGSLFFITIDRLQASVFEPAISNLFFAANAANAEVKGAEGDFIWAPERFDGLTISGGFSLLDTEITKVLVPTDRVTKGSSLAFAPELQFNLQARYEWDIASVYQAHVMPHISYSDDVYTDIITINRMQLDSWTLFGLTAGIGNDNWSAEAYIDNLSDERAQLSGNFNYDRARITVARPRTLGLRFSYNF